ncbi:MAG: hypothetical protein V5A77_00900 [Candidatus Bipolaricaulota bacterium]
MNSSSVKYARVAIFRPIRSTFEYSLPAHLKEKVTSGSVCRLPFRGEDVRGVVLEIREEPQYEGERKEIKELISRKPLPGAIIELARWLSYSTLTPIGQVLNRFVPGDLSVRPRTREIVELKTSFQSVSSFIERNEKKCPKQVELLEFLLSQEEPVEKNELLRKANSSRSPLAALREKDMVEMTSLPEMGGQEAETFEGLSSPLDIGRESREIPKLEPDGFAQYAVNGRGGKRLAAYLGVIQSLAENGTVLVLAPNVIRAEEIKNIVREELSLIALSYHSDLTDGEISSRWNLALEGEVDVFVGVLSAVYLPVPRLRAIIVEGDGERNYDLTEQDPKGNLIETARKRAELETASLILGGRGPSVESYYRITAGELETITGDFPEGFKRPVDLALEWDSGDRALGPGLRRALKWSYGEEGPALIVGSKRGTSSAAICDECGEVVRCPDCEVPLTFTGSGNYGICPYCGSKANLLVCENCGSDELNFIGSGLEKAESEVRSLLPEADVRLFDSQEETWDDFLKLAGEVLRGKVDVLLGTSIVESLYFQDRNSLIGLLDLDLVNNRPSYRSTEFLLQRVLAALDLVKDGGKVLLGTQEDRGGPFDLIKSGNWRELYERELKSRRRMGYPPLRSLIKVEVERGEKKEARDVALKLKKELTSAEGNYKLLGPTSNTFEKRKGQYRSDLIVKAEEAGKLFDLINSLVSEKEYGEVRLNPFA